MSDSCNPESTTGKAIKRKLKKGAKYNYDFVQIASRMVAAGMTEKDIGYVLGVKPTTIAKWKQRYAEFKSATDSNSSAKEIAKSYLVANGLRAAMGFDFEEVDQVLELNSDGEMIVKKETRKLRHRPVDKDLLMFFLLNISNEYHNVKSIQIEQTKKNLNVSITGNLESSDIRKLAGAAFNEADKRERVKKNSNVIEAEFVEKAVVEKSDANADFLEGLNE